MNRPITEKLTFITDIPSHFIQDVNYPGEARYLSLMPGLKGEIWYDDGVFTGVTRLMLKHILTQTPIASYATHFQGTDGVAAFWFLLDRQNQHLFLGTRDAVSASLQRNVHNHVPVLHVGELIEWHGPYQY